MAEFQCYQCNTKVKTGEKFTFTKKGSVHFDCFISERRREVPLEKQEKLRVFSIILDLELQLLLGHLSIKDIPEATKEADRLKYKDIEKACGETNRLISEL